MKDRNELPSANEKGLLLARMAERGIVGLDLTVIAGLSRKEIAEVIKQKILAAKMVADGMDPESRLNVG